MNVVVPINRVLAIYTKENGQGMMFGDEEGGDEPPPPAPKGGGDQGAKKRPSKPKLKVVK